MTIAETFRAGIAGITGVDLTKIPNGGFEAAWFEPDAVWHYGPVMALPDEPPAWHGPDGILQGWTRWLDQWDEYILLPTAIEAYSETQLVLDFHTEAVGKLSRTPMSIEYSQVWTWRNGRVARVDFYDDHEAAVEALGRPTPLEIVEAGFGVMAGVDLTKLPNGGWDAEWFEPGAEFDLGQMALPDETVWRGREAILDGWGRWLEQWDDYRVSNSGAEMYGENRVITDIHAEVRGKGSGAPVSIDHTQVWTFRGIRILRIDVFRNKAEALEALSRSAPAAADAPRTPPAP